MKNENSETVIDSVEIEKKIKIKAQPAKDSGQLFENLEWLTTKEVAIYLRKISDFGDPSTNAIHKLVSKGKVRRRKFAGRLYFKKRELDYLVESSVS
jgi:hypothetical protein